MLTTKQLTFQIRLKIPKTLLTQYHVEDLWVKLERYSITGKSKDLCCHFYLVDASQTI